MVLQVRLSPGREGEQWDACWLVYDGDVLRSCLESQQANCVSDMIRISMKETWKTATVNKLHDARNGDRYRVDVGCIPPLQAMFKDSNTRLTMPAAGTSRDHNLVQHTHWLGHAPWCSWPQFESSSDLGYIERATALSETSVFLRAAPDRNSPG